MLTYVYSPSYRVDIGPHVFPTAKYAMLRRRLIEDFGVREEQFVEPEPAGPAEILSVHSRRYYEACRDSTLSVEEQMRMELPWSPALFDAATRCVRGSLLAARAAMETSAGLHIGGGFHHAFADHGEGFCVFNDPACAIRQVQTDGLIERAAVVDVDLHQGNGTAAIFIADPTVATFSIHQEALYPFPKPPSTVDVGLPPGIDDRSYLDMLESNLVPMLDEHEPDLVFYIAGADPYRDDQLGSLGLSVEGLMARDRLVCQICRERNLPVAVVLAGGYAHNVQDTVQIHLNTLQEVAKLRRETAPA